MHLGRRTALTVLPLVAASLALLVPGAPPSAAGAGGGSAATEASHWSGPTRVFPRTAGLMTSLSCVSVRDCTAVDELGSAIGHTGTWGRPRAADHDLGPLSAVSCPADGTCAAVGGRRYAVERHGHWGKVHLAAFHLTSVSCATSRNCVAVGEGGRALVRGEHGWHRARRAGHGDLTAVSCWATGRCLSVARSGRVFELRGGSWHRRQAVPHELTYASLSCGSARLCVVATDDDRVYRWNGHRWTRHRFLQRHVSTYAGVVSCAGVSFCAWIDSDGNMSFWRHGWGKLRTKAGFRNAEVPPLLQCPAPGRCFLAEPGNSTRSHSAVLRSGHWSPAAPYPGDLRLPSEVSCPTATFCMAVDRAHRPAIYDGKAWSRAPGTVPPRFGPSGDVSCPSTTFCMTVSALAGSYVWQAGTWSSEELPFQDQWSLDCASATWCALVGYYDDGPSESRILDGTQLVEAPVPDMRTSDVSCPDVDDCWATAGGDVVAHFDGSTWTEPERLYPGSGLGGGISCPTTDFCVAWSPTGKVVAYTGGSWQAPVDVGGLTTLTCASPMSCTGLRAAPRQSFVVRFDGTAWTSARSLPRGYGVPVKPRAYLVAAQTLSCPTDDDCVLLDMTGNAYRRTS